MLEGQVLGAAQCIRDAQDLRDMQHCIVSPYALLACEFLFSGYQPFLANHVKLPYLVSCL
jgi:hypothetical protein